jgi:ABC-type uncharacterized transport system ATPase subunit
MRGITGLVRPSGGRVLFKGEEVTRLPAHAKVARGLAMVPEGRMLPAGWRSRSRKRGNSASARSSVRFACAVLRPPCV